VNVIDWTLSWNSVGGRDPELVFHFLLRLYIPFLSLLLLLLRVLLLFFVIVVVVVVVVELIVVDTAVLVIV